jgi:hypothetical protein
MKFMQTLNKVWGPNGSCGIPTDDLTASQQDELFAYQLAQKNPYMLTEDSLIMTKVCGTSHPSPPPSTIASIPARRRQLMTAL